jgi:hypothetical protein
MQIYNMSSINSIIKTATIALAGVHPDSLTSDQLNSSKEILDGINIDDAIDEYWRSLPGKPENEDELPGWEAEMREKAKRSTRNCTS